MSAARVWWLVCVTMGLGAGGSAWAARDIRAAQKAVDEAQLALAGKRYVAAAEAMEKAYDLDPNPLWLANAGYARMMAGQQERAVEAMSAALADKNLDGEARVRAVERLGHASAAKAFIARSEEAKTQGDLAAAARAYDEAYSAVPIGPYALEAATLWERAKNYQRAEERYTQAAAAQDLTPEQQRMTVEALSRVARLAKPDTIMKPDVPPPDATPKPVVVHADDGGGGSPVVGWVLVGTGAAATIGGVVMLLAGNGQASDLQAAQDGAEDGVVKDLSREDALAMQSDAEMLQTTGVIATIAGVAIAGTGVVLVLLSGGRDAPDTRGDVHVGAGFDGRIWALSASGSF